MVLNIRIRQLRLSNNLTAIELSRIFGISESSVSLYESGKRTPNIGLIKKYSNFFNVSTDYLLGISDVPKPYHIEHQMDFAVYIEDILTYLDNNEFLLFDGKLMNKKFKYLFRKNLLNFIDTMRIYFSHHNYN